MCCRLGQAPNKALKCGQITTGLRLGKPNTNQIRRLARRYVTRRVPLKFLKIIALSLVLAGCASTNVQYAKYENPTNLKTAEVEFWVHGFRNNGTILLGYIDPNEKGEMTTIYEIAKLQTNGLFEEPTKSVTVDIPATDLFPLFYDNTSAGGYVTTNCYGYLPLKLNPSKKYKIEVINWTPKEATFADFTCEFDINEVLADGSLRQIKYVKPEANK